MKNISIISILICFLFSCGNEVNQDNKNEKIKLDLDTNLNLDKNKVYENYSIPLPIEIFEFIKNKQYFSEKYLSNIIDKDLYLTDIQNATFLGIYTSDLAYCTIFKNTQKSIEYTNIASYLSNELYIKDSYGKKIKKRLEKNISNPDSLIIITNNAYVETCNFLEQRGVKNLLPFVIYGGWIETLNILTYSESEKNTKDDINNLIISMQKDIDNIITYLYDVQVETSAYHFNEELKIIINDLKELNRLFDNYKIDKNNDNFKNIIKKIHKMRNKCNNL